MSAVHQSQQAAAMALLMHCQNGEIHLTRKAGSFLGQLEADPTPMTEAQASWLDKLLMNAGLPELREV